VCDLSVTIISFDMGEMLAELLRSIQTHTTGIKYEIIVVDNHSSDQTAAVVRRDFPSVRFIENRENRGVASARNQAFMVAKGKFVVTMDADMVLGENALGKMVKFMETHLRAGICGCKLAFPDGTVQPSARRFPTPLAFLMRRLDFLGAAKHSRSLRSHEMADWDRTDTRPVDYVIGACQMIRREAMDEVGLLDEHIFYGPEDVDYCIRMKQKGWSVFYFSGALMIHYEQRATRKRLFSKLSFRHLQGVLYLFWKYKGKLSAHVAQN